MNEIRPKAVCVNHATTAQTNTYSQASALEFERLTALTDNRLGIVDVPCPACGPLKERAVSAKRRVLRVYHEQPDFVGYHCARCGAHGWAADKAARRIEQHELSRRMREADARHSAHVQRRRRLANWLWGNAEPVRGTLAERYLRARGITCDPPGTLRFLPEHGRHPPALVAAFGIPNEREPGLLDVAGMTVHGLHLTKLRRDGSGKAGVEPAKIMLGPTVGLPIVLAPVNDVGGLLIAEGLEDALSLHQATGLGGWAAGCANRLPALARAVPRYVESVTVAVDDDDAGHRYARELAQQLKRLRGRRFEVVMLEASEWRIAA